MAIYPSGVKGLMQYMAANVKLDSTQNGSIKISFIVSCSGKTCGFEIVERKGIISNDTENIITDSLKQMNTRKPAKQRGKTIDIPYILSINIVNGIIRY
jgi:hypothetical protein